MYIYISQNGERISQRSRQHARDNNRTVEDAQTLCIYAPHDNVLWWSTCASFAQKSSRVLFSFLSRLSSSPSLFHFLCAHTLSRLCACHGLHLIPEYASPYSYRQDIVSTSFVYGHFLASVCDSFHRTVRFLLDIQHHDFVKHKSTRIDRDIFNETE